MGPVGRARARTFAARPGLAAYRRIVASTEVKAQETAQILAAALALPVAVRANLHENDRSATGYLPEPEFQAMADAFFANPRVRVRGWEPAADAQARIVAAVEAARAEAPQEPTLFVGHGGVGTLLLCHLAGYPIARVHDQPPVGGGCGYEAGAGIVPGAWRTMEEAV